MNLKKMLMAKNIVKEGHFRLTSGDHSDKYINKDEIHHYPNIYRAVIQEYVNYIRNVFKDVEVITGPAVAGAVIARSVADKMILPFAYPEKIDGEMVFRRGYENLIKDKRVVIVEDIVTTGGSVNKTIQAIRKNKGIIHGVAILWNRTRWHTYECDVVSLIDEICYNYKQTNCPLCHRGLALFNPKTGEEIL